jgi:excisionase family DNA binding protein
VRGAYPQASDVNGDNSDSERINAVNKAGLEEGLLTVKDLSNFLGCGRTKAWELVTTRQIRSVRVGRLVRLEREAIEEFIESSRR